MRLLYLRHDHDGGLAAEAQARCLRCRDRPIDGRQHLPLWNPAAHCVGDSTSGESHERVQSMITDLKSENSLEPERYELTQAPAYHFEVGRREFFRCLGAGVLIVCAWNDARALQESGVRKDAGD